MNLTIGIYLLTPRVRLAIKQMVKYKIHIGWLVANRRTSKQYWILNFLQLSSSQPILCNSYKNQATYCSITSAFTFTLLRSASLDLAVQKFPTRIRPYPPWHQPLHPLHHLFKPLIPRISPNRTRRVCYTYSIQATSPPSPSSFESNDSDSLDCLLAPIWKCWSHMCNILLIVGWHSFMYINYSHVLKIPKS